MSLKIAVILVFLFSIGQDVQAAQCHKSGIFRWRCAPCGKGTRCIFCLWCSCYCWKGRRKRSASNVTLPEYGNTTVQYKKPLIEMFEDLEKLIENDQISIVEVVELYKVTSDALSEDCRICNDIPEIHELRNITISVHKKLENIMISENITSPGSTRKKRSPSFISLESDKVKKIVLESTREALNATHKIPESVLGKIDLNSTIIDNSG